MMKDVFTTFEVGQICRVYHTTVINWINKGRLRAYTTPGKHRRIHRADLLDFMKKFNMDVPAELSARKKTILVVDDDPAILDLVRKTFSKDSSSIELQTSPNVVEALVSVGRNRPDLIILDIIMPGMDGIAVCRALKSGPETEGIKIIAVTGKSLSREEESFLRKNVEEVFKKPFSPLALIDKSRQLLSLEAPLGALT